MEMIAVAFLHDIQNMFSSEPTTKKEKVPSSSVPRGFSIVDVHKKFNQLADALPQLRDLDYLFEVLQIPVMAQRGLRGMWNAASSVQVYMKPTAKHCNEYFIGRDKCHTNAV